MTRLSILDLEQRLNPVSELEKFHFFLRKERFTNFESFQEYLNPRLNLIPYMGSSMSIEGYFTERGIDLKSKSAAEATTALLYLISFYETYDCWSRVSNNYNIMYRESYDTDSLRVHRTKIVNVINSLLKQLNYQVIYEEEDNQYNFKAPLIVKRDTDVDSVLPLVDSDIRIDLLSYLDFRIENNLQAKQSILARLYKTIIDDGKDKFSTKSEDPKLKYQNELYRKISQIYNQTDIRHGGEKIELTDEEKHKYYDMCFYLLLQLIRTPKSIEDMDEISKKFNPKQKVNS